LRNFSGFVERLAEHHFYAGYLLMPGLQPARKQATKGLSQKSGLNPKRWKSGLPHP